MKLYANKRIDDDGFANPQSKLLTLMPVILSTLATTTVIGVSIIATVASIGLFPLTLYFAAAFLILTAPLFAKTIYQHLYNKASAYKKSKLDKKFRRVVFFSSIISFVGSVIGVVCSFTVLPFSFLAVPIALLVLFIISLSYLLYNRYKKH